MGIEELKASLDDATALEARVEELENKALDFEQRIADLENPG